MWAFKTWLEPDSLWKAINEQLKEAGDLGK